MENIIDTNIDAKVEDTKVDESVVETTKVEDKKYLQITQEDLDEIITKRLERASKKAEEVKVEAERLATMSEADRQQAKNEKKEAATTERERILDIREALTESGLKAHLIKRFKNSTLETIGEDIEEYKAEIKEAVADELNKTMRGNTPKTGSGKVTGTTKEDFNKMPYKERMALYNENQELYQELNK